MPRTVPPAVGDPGRFAGLRQRRRERGLPVGTEREVEIVCRSCGEAWTVVVPEGAAPTDEDLRCPQFGCDGEGRVAL